MKKPSSFTKKLFLVVLSIFLSLIMAEIGTRVYIFGAKAFSYKLVNSAHQLGGSGLIQPSSESEIIYELKPGLNEFFKLVRFKTNSIGLREEREYSLEKPFRTFRVAVVGDSYTLGSGIEVHDTYPKVLEKQLNNYKGRYEFINFGVGGYSLRQYVAVIKFKALKFHPDLILIGWCAGNDHEIDPEINFSRKYNVRPTKSGFFKSYLVQLFIHVVSHKGVSKKAIYKPNEIDHMNAMFNKIERLPANTPVVVVNLGFDEQNGPILERLAKSCGLHFVDTIPAFQGKNQRDYVIHLLDKHPNARANLIFAKVIQRYLLEQRLLDFKE